MPTLVELHSTAESCAAETVPSPSPRRLEGLRALLDSEALRLAATIALYCFPAFLFIRAFYLVDPDIWWHLRAGQWILQHHAVPATDPFSSYGAGKPWVLYSWLFDAFIASALNRLGLVAIAYYQIAVRIVLTVALFGVLRAIAPGFWRAAALTAAAIFAMTRVLGPRPGMMTILLVTVVLGILLSVTRSGRTPLLWLLPPLFALWANWHIQFIYGLFVLGVFAAEPWLNSLFRYRPRAESKLSPAVAWLALASSTLATLLNPYGIKVYSTVFLYAGQTRMYNFIMEFLAMNFRQPQHFLTLLLALGAAMAIGWRRDPRPVWLILLSVTSALAFRSVREVWFLAIVAACIIADGWESPGKTLLTAPRTSLRSRALIGVWVLALTVAACRHYDLSNDALEIQAAGSFPEGAVRYIEMHHLEGPLLNDFNWGGYLIWRLPNLPVALDGRTNVHDEDRILRFSIIWSGKPGWESDPDLARSNLVLTPRDAAIASLLRTSSRFQIAYEDSQAIVFRRR